jgi:hypothetical protein
VTYDRWSYALFPVWLLASGAALALAAAAETARYAVGATLLAGSWALDGPKLALGALRPAGGRNGR